MGDLPSDHTGWVGGEMVVRDGREEEGWKELEGILDKKYGMTIFNNSW